MRSTPPRFGPMVDVTGFSGSLGGAFDGRRPTATTNATAIAAKPEPTARNRANIVLLSVPNPVVAVAAPPHYRRRRECGPTRQAPASLPTYSSASPCFLGGSRPRPLGVTE